MLSFLRANSIKIVYGIILSFVITTFFGVVFFNDSFKTSSDQAQTQLDIKSAIATIGELPVKRQTYLLSVRRIQSSIPADTQITLQLYEQLQVRALNRAIEDTLLTEYGKSTKVGTKKSEINVQLYSIMEQFNVSSKKELKVAIRQQGGSYEDLLNQLKDDLIASKVRNKIIDSVQLTDQDRENIDTKFHVKELFISKYSTNNVRIDESKLLNNVQTISNQITNSSTFDEQIALNYDKYGFEKPEKLDVWISINERNQDIMSALYDLKVGDISKPIKTENGFYFVELLGKEQNIVTNNLTEDNLVNVWKNNVFYNFLFDIQNFRELKIIDPSIRATKFKLEGRYDEAIEAYQALDSLDPSNPYTNLLISQIYQLKGSISEEKQELLIAELKESLIGESVEYPQIHLRLAQIYEIEGFNDKRDSQYDKLLTAKDNVSLLKALENIFNENGDKNRLSLTKELLEAALSTENILIEEDNPFEGISLDNAESTDGVQN